MEDSVHDDPHDNADMPAITNPAAAVVVRGEDDVIGQEASILYHDMLKQLLNYSVLPVKACPRKDPSSKTQCNEAFLTCP